MDRTRKPIEDMMWEVVKPAMRIMGDLSDLWERFGKYCPSTFEWSINGSALEPRQPFDKMRGKRRIAGMVAPFMVISIFVNAEIAFRMSTFFFGVGFFGQPLISPTMSWLNQNYPKWKNVFEIKKSSSTICHSNR